MNRHTLVARLARRVSRDPLLRAVRALSRDSGVPAWLVGGYVRDTALSLHPRDIDLIGGAGTLRLVRRLEAHWGQRGFRFRKRGVTTWRFSVAGREIDLVDAARRGLAGDLRRREATINAIAYDLDAAQLFDPLGGLGDLRAGLLRAPRPEVFAEDPLRALRAARFLAQLPGFRLHRQLHREAAAVASRLRRASTERVRDELDRLLAADAPRRGLDALRSLGLVEPVLPELAPLGNCVAGDARPDVWTHTLDAIGLSENPGRRRLPGFAVVRDLESRRILRWALLLHDVAKPDTLEHRDDGRPTFHGHEVLGARRSDAILRRLKLPRRDRRRIAQLVLFHLRPGHLADAGAPARGLRRLVREAERDLPLLVLHAACDAVASGSPDARRRWLRLARVLRELLRLQQQRCAEPLPRLLGGRDVIELLGLEPGPAVGRVLDRLQEAQEAGDVRTRAQAARFVRTQGAR